MSNATMKAKLKVFAVTKHYRDETNTEMGGISLKFYAVGPSSPYPKDGNDENNTFSLWTPSAELTMYVTNPALFDSFGEGDEFYVDFTKVAKEG